MDSRLRVNYDYQIFSMQVYGGVSRYVVELASHIARMPHVCVRVVAPIYVSKLLASGGALPKTGLHLRHRLPHTVTALSILNAVVSRVLLPTLPADIVHETYYSALRTAPQHAKVVLTVHDLIEERLGRTDGAMGRAKRAAIQRADHVICISQSTRNDLLHWCSVPRERVSVIYLAGSLGDVPSSPPPVSGPYILYVGQRGGYKNFRRLVEAIGISELHRSFKLICFGGGPASPEEMRLIAGHRIPFDHVEFVSGDDTLLKGYYEGAALFVYPSLYEGFGIPLLEAMQCGCPVICSDTSCFREVAEHSAEYFDPADTASLAATMVRVLQSSELLGALVRGGRLRAEMFSWSKCAHETYSCYRDVVGH
ncbi:MAG TPA: glycosyltransferase family 1 protein [Terriglobales bacterium]|nr:glycosyltransferase family 1 protein [Terriglobales bacterium]